MNRNTPSPPWPLLPLPATCLPKRHELPMRQQPTRHERVAHTWLTVTGCHDCHTPLKQGAAGPEPDMSRMLSGHPQSLVMTPAPSLDGGPWGVAISKTNTAWSGFWGVTFTANLTPDEETGLGRWTLRNFRDTLHTGRHLGRGREILPPMPIPLYKQLTDEDIEAIFTFLRSIPAVRNKVPEPLPVAQR